MAVKGKEKQECYRLWVEEGVHEWVELAKRSGLSIATCRKVITLEARRDYNERVNGAKRLYVEKGVSDIDTLCTRAQISRALWQKIYNVQWDAERAAYLCDNPVLYRTGDLLYQAAEALLIEVRTLGYNDQSVDKLVKLANAHEQFRTGEYRLESIMLGMAEFTVWFRANAKSMKMRAADVRRLVLCIHAFRKYVQEQLGAILQLHRMKVPT